MQSNNWLIIGTILIFSIFSFELATAQTVVINGQTLSKQEVQAIETMYGIQCQTGYYWYDKVSGLVGVQGQAPFTIMDAGYTFGTLNAKASGGNTGVFFNGRELSLEEWKFWSNLNGSYIYQGSYWMDHNGNAGISGNSTALVNFYAKANQLNHSNANNGTGGTEGDYSNYNSYSKRQNNNGGGNEWGTKWSHGNSDGNVHVISSMWGVLDY